MSGKPVGEEPKKQTSITLDVELWDLLQKEKNKSSLLEELLRAYYAKTITQMQQEREAKLLEEKNRTTSYSCTACHKSSWKSEWLEKKGYCPKCGASSLLAFFEKHFPEGI
jgi:rubrerythrin